MRPPQNLFSALLLVVLATPANASVELDKLTQCADLRGLWAQLHSGDPTFAQRCSSPVGLVQRAMVPKFKQRGSIDLCFLSTPPANFLNAFQCSYTWNSADSAGLLCVREIPKLDLDDYFHHHDEAQYSARINDYLNAASRCANGHGDSTVAKSSLSPVAVIASFKFGFVLTSRTTTGSDMAVHGYATIDPAIGVNPQSALEFVSVFVAPMNPPLDDDNQIRQVGDWSVSVDQGKKLKEVMDEGFRKLGVPVLTFARLFEVKKVSGKDDNDAVKNTQLSAWADLAADTLRHSDFEAFTKEDFQHAHLHGLEDIRSRMRQGIAYGFRDNGTVVIGDKFIIMKNEWSPPCATTADGGLGAGIMTIKPHAEIASDHGSVLVMIYGIGACARRASETAAYIEKLLDEAETDLIKNMGM